MAIQTRYTYILRYILVVTDLMLLNVVYYLAYYITANNGYVVNSTTNCYHIVVCNLIWLFCASVFGLQNSEQAGKPEKSYRGTWRSVLVHIVLFAMYLLFSVRAEFPGVFLIIFYGLLTFAFILSRFIGTSFRCLIINKLNATKKVAVMGTDNTAIRLATYFEEQKNVQFYGFIGGDDSFYVANGAMLPEFVSRNLTEASANGVKDIYVVIAHDRMNEVSALVREAEKQCLRLKFVPNLVGPISGPYKVNYLAAEFPVITLRHEPLEDIKNRFKKRAIDVVFSALVIICIMSWLYPLMALLIKLQSKGPVLFKQMRSGRNDEPFLCYKFRSMQMNDDSDEIQATKDDGRVTAFGSFLRRTALDEMPQFFNVFIGNMSVVGPRPHMLKHTEQYKLIINQYMVRHFLKPGITGWAQVNGFRGETKKTKDMQRRIECDIYYLEKWTAMLDVKIIFMTIINAIRGDENAY